MVVLAAVATAAGGCIGVEGEDCPEQAACTSPTPPSDNQDDALATPGGAPQARFFGGVIEITFSTDDPVQQDAAAATCGPPGGTRAGLSTHRCRPRSSAGVIERCRGVGPRVDL